MNAAVFTMVRDEEFFLPLWLKYYSRYFQDIYILEALKANGPCHHPNVMAQGFLTIPQDHRLLLFHLHYVDRDQCRRKNFHNASYPLLPKTVHSGWARQCLITGEELERHLKMVATGEHVEIPRSLRQNPPI